MIQSIQTLRRHLNSRLVILVLLALFLMAVVFLGLPKGSSASALNLQGRDELRVQLTSSGFVPSAIEHAAGTFAIAVDNSSLSGEYTLRLKAQDGTVLKEIVVQKGSSAWSVSLGAGDYTITEINNPSWICALTVH